MDSDSEVEARCFLAEAKARHSEYWAKHRADPEFFIMSTATLLSLVDEVNRRELALWRTPQIEYRSSTIMGCKIRICETVDGVHVVG